MRRPRLPATTISLHERKQQTQSLADRLKRCGALNHQLEIIVHDLGSRRQRQTEMAQ